MRAGTWEAARHRALGTEVHLLVTDPETLPEAEHLLLDLLAAVDLAASRFRQDSELVRLRGGRTALSPLLTELVRAALWAAEETQGLVDPTLGRQLCEAGYDLSFELLPADGPTSTRTLRPGRWRELELDGDLLDLPEGVLLDLGATAKAWAADAAAARIAALGTGVLVNLGGDLAVEGTVPDGGWPVAVRQASGSSEDHTVAVTCGGVATSSTTARVWRRGGLPVHHVLDPRTGAVASSDWSSVTVAAGTCLEANALSTAGIVLGAAAPGWLVERGVPALLQSRGGPLVRLGGWP
jgi:thiamine biosynthesis lipoprotein